MSLLATIGYIAGAVGFVATLVSAAVIVRSTTVKQTISTQNDLIDVLTRKVAALEKSDAAKGEQIKSLQHEVDTFKTIPLAQIVATQESILSTQREIIQLLNKEG